MGKNFLFLGVLFLPVQALAAVTLSVMPIDGNNSLRLEQGLSGSNKAEVRVRVVSAGGNRYQVFQRVVGPLVNEKGQSLDLQAVETQSLPNSNTGGTLYLQNPQSLGLSEELVYTSPENGQNDAFIIGYTLRPEYLSVGTRFLVGKF